MYVCVRLNEANLRYLLHLFDDGTFSGFSSTCKHDKTKGSNRSMSLILVYHKKWFYCITFASTHAFICDVFYDVIYYYILCCVLSASRI